MDRDADGDNTVMEEKMKLSRTIILISFLLISFMWKFDMLYAQTRPVQEGETIIGPVTSSIFKTFTSSSSSYGYTLPELEAYQALLAKAREDFPDRVVDIRKVQISSSYRRDHYEEQGYRDRRGNWTYSDRTDGRNNTPATRIVEYYHYYTFTLAGDVVELPPPPPPQPPPGKPGVAGALERAVAVAFRDVPQRSRVAITEVNAVDRNTRDDTFDLMEDILDENGFRVVDRITLDSIRDELDLSDSEGFNQNQRATFGRLTGASYIVTVRVRESQVRVRVVSVNTGEVTGNTQEVQ